MKKRRLSLRTYLALWIALMLFFTGMGLIVAINSVAAVLLDSNIFFLKLPQIDEIPFSKDVSVEIVEEGPFKDEGESLKAGEGPAYKDDKVEIAKENSDLTNSNGEGVIEEEVLTYDQVVQKALTYLRLISVASLAVMLLIGGLGAYWLSKKALRPVQYLSQTVKRIHSKNLTERIPTDGPDDEIKELACSFNEMLSQLEQYFCQQRRFISDAAHELRTPLSILQINLEALEDNPETTIDEYREALGVLNGQLDRLKRLINDLLAMSGSGTIEPRERVNLKALITEVIAALEPVAEQYQVTLHQTADADAYCFGKELLLNRALSNIIENAVRYNRAGGKVCVGCDERQDDILVTVSDTGIGMAKEEQPYIFEPFYRIERSRSRHFGGAGLGLTVTALIVEGHGGAISVKSAPEEGSSFTITLPKKTRRFADAVPGDANAAVINSGTGAIGG